MYKLLVAGASNTSLLIGTCANGVRLARGAALEAVWIVGLAIAAAFDIAKAIVNVVWVTTGEFTATIGHNLKHTINHSSSRLSITSEMGSVRMAASRPPGW